MEPTKNTYHPETYWNRVAGQLAGRTEGNLIAGDDEPYYRYKRRKFLKIFDRIAFGHKRVLEVGCGPGGNLAVVAEKNPSELAGVDLSPEMIALAKKNLEGKPAKVFHIPGRQFPFSDRYFDIVFTSTVLQHTTSDTELRATVSEMCRVCNNEVYIFERIEKKIKGNESCLGRTIAFYEQLFGEYGFELEEKEFLHIEASYVMAGATRKLLNPRGRREGEKLTGISLMLQRLLLPVTTIFDNIYKKERDLAMLHFKLKANE